MIGQQQPSRAAATPQRSDGAPGLYTTHIISSSDGSATQQQEEIHPAHRTVDADNKSRLFMDGGDLVTALRQLRQRHHNRRTRTHPVAALYILLTLKKMLRLGLPLQLFQVPRLQNAA